MKKTLQTALQKTSMLVMFFLLLFFSAEDADAAVKKKLSEDASKVDAGESWLSVVQRDIREREYHAQVGAQGLSAPNRKHNLRFFFSSDGLRVLGKTGQNSKLTPSSLLELQLMGLSRKSRDSLLSPSFVQLDHDLARIELKYENGIVEWYENSANGLEHGFVLEKRPVAGDDELFLKIAIGGASASLNGEALQFNTNEGRILDYGKLLVTDVTGRKVPARFELGASSTFSIVLADKGFQYPLLIDPLLTSSIDSQFEANQADARMGISIASAGDVNGDGFGDVIVGASAYDNGEADEGAAFVYHGSANGLNTSAAVQLESNQASALMGAGVACAGDINGDGYDDVIVGAYKYSNGENFEGAVFVYHGSASGLSTAANMRLESNQIDAQLGISVASAGDVNGDGFSDIIVGANSFNNGQTEEGAAFVYHGSPGGLSSVASAQLETNQANSQLGFSVAGAGDVNGDGFSDVIVGAYAYDNGQNAEGAAFVYYGSDTGVGAVANVQLESNQETAQFGISVASAGDVNGDGFSDIIVGADSYNSGQLNEGVAFVYYGSAGGVGTSANVQLESNQASALFGFSVAGAGDVNGDGYSDVIVGAYKFDNGNADEGAAFVYHGSASGLILSASAQLEANQGDAWMGASVASAGDINGDGYADVIVGAFKFSNGQSDEGAAFVYHGSGSGLHTEFTVQLEGNQDKADFGISVASAGDVNGDGYADVIVGADTFDNGQSDEGAAFVYHGSINGLSTSANIQLESNQDNAGFGASVASAGDVNGDGYDDVIVGAGAYTNGESGEGAAFVYHGSASGVSPVIEWQGEGDQDDARFGISVASAGDVNGDGYGDVVVGADSYNSGQSDEGVAFVYYGSINGLSIVANTQLELNQDNAGFGASVAAAGDVNGDGYGDVIVGASAYSNVEIAEGAVFVYHGSINGLNPLVQWQVEADQAGAMLGTSVASAGDVNGDGFGDVVVGASAYTNGQTGEGAAFVYHGSVSGLSPVIEWQGEGNQGDARFGISVATAGDVNGDGYDDVVVGADSYDNGQSDEGAVFIYLGAASGLKNTANTQLEINQLQAFSGSSVAFAGDVNGDGYGDVIVGASSYDNGQSDEGAAFVYYGNGGNNSRSLLLQQLDGEAIPGAVGLLGTSSLVSGFVVQMNAYSPAGRARVKLQVEACEAGIEFGDLNCTVHSGSNWSDVGTTGAVRLTELISGLSASTLYRWRARVLYAAYTITQSGIVSPMNPRHGPWRYFASKAGSGDIYTFLIGRDSDLDGVSDEEDDFFDNAAASVDEDNDGLPDEWNTSCDVACQEASGLTLDVLPDDSDNDGIADEDDNVEGDNLAPIVMAPEDITVTAIDDLSSIYLGAAWATDVVDGAVSVLPDTKDVSSTVSLPPGVTLITWLATDAAGNTGTDIQRVNVFPLAGFATQETLVAKGSLVNVMVKLNGNSPAYPVSVPVEVSGESTGLNPEDHNAINDVVVITSDAEPADTAIYQFVAGDQNSITGGADVTVILNIVNDNGRDMLSENFGIVKDANQHVVTITERNLPPDIEFSVRQFGLETTNIIAYGAAVHVRALINDPNPQDTHELKWFFNGRYLAESDDQVEIMIPLNGLDPGEYDIQLAVTDSGNPAEVINKSRTIAVRLFVPDSSGDTGSVSIWSLLCLLFMLVLARWWYLAECYERRLH